MGSVTERPRSPTPDLCRRRECARVPHLQRDINDRLPCQSTWNKRNRNMRLVKCAIAEFAAGVPSPTGNLARRCDATGAGRSSRQLRDSLASQCSSRDLRGQTSVHRRSVADLAVLVRSPAHRFRCFRHRTRVRTRPNRDGRNLLARQRASGHGDRDVSVDRGSNSESAVDVLSPTRKLPLIGDGTGLHPVRR